MLLIPTRSDHDRPAPAAACDICCEPFNRSTRKPVACGCGATACRECAERYLLESPNDPQCMACRRPWSPSFLAEKFAKVFVTSRLRKHREEVLFDREKSLLPDTQADAEAYMRHQAYKKKRAEIRKKLKELAKYTPTEYDLRHYIKSFPLEQRKAIYDQQLARHREYAAIRAELLFIEMEYERRLFSDPEQHVRTRPYNIYGPYVAPPATAADAAGASTSAASTSAAASAASRTFMRACPAAGCRGFLSTAWKCGLCEVYVCPDCHEIKPGGREDPDHRCDPDTLASARLIASETRPCPKCAAVIYRISGCDHMFCTACKTPFHWRTGAVMEANSNPHYYEWRQRQRDAASGGAPAATDANNPPACFDDHWLLANARRYDEHIRNTLSDDNTLRPAFLQLPQVLSHNRYMAEAVIPRRDFADLRRDLRVSYLVGNIDEVAFKRSLVTSERVYARKGEMRDVIALYNDVTLDIARRAIGTTAVAAFHALHAERTALRDYVRQAFRDIAKCYGVRVPRIETDDWSIAL